MTRIEQRCTCMCWRRCMSMHAHNSTRCWTMTYNVCRWSQHRFAQMKHTFLSSDLFFQLNFPLSEPNCFWIICQVLILPICFFFLFGEPNQFEFWLCALIYIFAPNAIAKYSFVTDWIQLSLFITAQTHYSSHELGSVLCVKPSKFRIWRKTKHTFPTHAYDCCCKENMKLSNLAAKASSLSTKQRWMRNRWKEDFSISIICILDYFGRKVSTIFRRFNATTNVSRRSITITRKLTPVAIHSQRFRDTHMYEWHNAVPKFTSLCEFR